MNIAGWPDTDPYPYRELDGKNLFGKDEFDCFWVAIWKLHKAQSISAYGEEEEDCKYDLERAYEKINSLNRELNQEKARVKWLVNVGGEQLRLATGIDIVCRDMCKEREQVNA